MKVIRKIGSGGISDIYLVLIKDQKFAFKTLNCFNQNNTEAKHRLIREYEILTRVNHKNIVKCFDWVHYQSIEGLLLEFINGKRLDNLEITEITDLIFEQLTQTIDYLNNLNPSIIHNDLTEKNIMIDLNGNIKLIDFSFSKKLVFRNKKNSFFKKIRTPCRLMTDYHSLIKLKNKYK